MDAAGRTLQTSDPAGQTTAFAYDNQDRLLAVTENATGAGCPSAPCNVVTQYQYDRAGNRSAIVDARGNVRQFVYDAANQPIQITDALGRTTSWSYDAGGRRITQHDQRGSTFDLAFSYDELDRLTQSAASSLGTINAQYDALGRRQRLIDATGITSFTYDLLGRITQVQAPQSGAIGYGYDAAGRRAQLTYPDGTTLHYGYFADGQLHLVTGTTTLATYSYDVVGRLQSLTRANGTTTTASYDGADRLTELHTQVGSTTRSRFQYTLDRAGLRTVASETLGSATRTISYSYDGLLRLTDATETPGTHYAYAYDDVGNRTGVWINGTRTLTQTYNAANQVVGWSYDAAGNLTNDGTTTYTYDALNRLTQRGSTSYSYNGDGVLVSDGATQYIQDLAAPLSQVLATTDGVTTTDYLYGLERLVAVHGGTRTWYGSDALGSVRQTLSDTGTPLSSVSYDPWGVVESGTVPTFGFTSEVQDAASGLVYLRARWYNPAQGTFTAYRWRTDESNDEVPYSHHPYAYALGNPILYTDPTGKFSENWPDVRALSSSIIDIAAWHVKHAPHDLHGVTPEVLATIMGATIAIEDNWGVALVGRQAGDLLHFFTDNNPSTGIANYQIGTAMDLLNAGNCKVPLKFNRVWRSPERLFPDQILAIISDQNPIDAPPFSEKTDFSLNIKLDVSNVYDRLQYADLSLDILAANLIKGVTETANAGIMPSIFNIANYHWFNGAQTAEELLAGTRPQRHGEHGVRVVRNFDTAAEELGLSIRLTSLPNGLQPYYRGVHPADATKGFNGTEQNWADRYADKIN